MELSTNAYMKAVHMASSPVGSDQSVVTTASRSSISTVESWAEASEESTSDWLSDTNDSPVSEATTPKSGMESPVSDAVAPKKGTEYRRTPLSSKARPFCTPLSTKARPFVSSKTLWKQEPHPAFLQAVVLQSVMMPSVAAPQPAPCFYSERAQDEVYLYNEALQEDIYLAKSKGPSNKKGPPSDEASTSDEISNSDTQTEEKSSPRSPSPEPVVKGKLAKKGTPRPTKSILSEPIPVKHTFIHYNETSDLEGDVEKLPLFSTRQTSRARSAPRVLIQNDFSKLSFSRDMAMVHLRHNCQPCAYFHNKIDGCRRGPECKFCHLCPADEIKKRKKLKIKALKEKLERQLEQSNELENDEIAAEEKAAVSKD